MERLGPERFVIIEHAAPDQVPAAKAFLDGLAAELGLRARYDRPGTIQRIRAALAFLVKRGVGTATIVQREEPMIRSAIARLRHHPRIERFFNFIKQFRGIATRYEKTARNLLAGLHLACALAWLK